MISVYCDSIFNCRIVFPCLIHRNVFAGRKRLHIKKTYLAYRGALLADINIHSRLVHAHKQIHPQRNTGFLLLNMVFLKK